MNVDSFASILAARITSSAEQRLAEYDAKPELDSYWMMVDLVASTNYRLQHGPRAGYVRGETFLALVEEVIGYSSEIRSVKEIGDAVLLTAQSFRPLLEAAVLIHRTAQRPQFVPGTAAAPIGVRSAIHAGAAKRLPRTWEDYLGTPIDQLARLMGVREEGVEFLLSDDVFVRNRAIVDEYAPGITAGSAQSLDAKAAKGMAVALRYRPVRFRWDDLGGFSRHFGSWRPLVPGTSINS